MGSIQALRSDALANRSKADTNLEVSSFLGGVNKSLGSQIVKIVDDLQGVISQRAKAGNGLMAQINQTINGKGGIGDQAIGWTFKLANILISVTAMLIQIGKGNTPDVSSLIQNATDLTTIFLNRASIEANLASAVYDYKKMVSQTGVSSVDSSLDTNNNGSPDEYSHSGAVTLTKLRYSFMVRYKAEDIAYPSVGYVGTLRRI